ALQTGGVHVVGQEEFHLARVRATSATADAGPVDVLLFCVKTYDTDDAIQLIMPLVGPQTMVLPVQNGVDSYDRIGAAVGPERVVGGLCRISVDIPTPGTVRLSSPFREIIFGEMDGTPSSRTASFAAVLERAEIPHRISAEVPTEIWKKFIFITAFSALTGSSRSPIGPIRECPEALELYGRVAAEALAVGLAEGVPIEQGYAEELVKQARTLAAGMKASLLVDLERGRRTEVETLQGAVVRLGRKHGIATPVTEVLYGLIKLYQPR
ncbi:MAG: 2-dehydropantoate 2-reductase, partial [Firmicutes bacterium]|nr:2-dehydropantoate 2-reductase [Bacillota bacterium]